MYFLGKYTARQPERSNQWLVTLGNMYQMAKKILAHQFGNPFLIADTYRKKINDWPKITPFDGSSL